VSEIEYLKRSLYAGITGTIADDDDDAELASIEYKGGEEHGTTLTAKYDPRDALGLTITKEQLADLNYELADHPDLAALLLKQLNLKYLADLPQDKFRTAMERLRKIKAMKG
jgi:hypothetical protein